MSEIKPNTATYKGFAVVIQQDTKKEGLPTFSFNDLAELVKLLKPMLSTNDFYYLIKHDKDIQEDGTPKREHIHIVFALQSKHSKKAFFEHLVGAINQHPDSVSIQELMNVEGAVRYLIHKDNPEKAQYNDFEILTNDTRYERYIYGLEMWLIDCMKTSLNFRIFAEKVGLDYANKYRGIAKDFIAEYGAPSREQFDNAISMIEAIRRVAKGNTLTATDKITKIKELLDC